MTPKEYLSQYQQLNRDINRLLEEKERWKALATRVTLSQSEGGRGSGSQNGRIPSAVEKIMETEDKINARIDQLIDLRQEIESRLDTLPDGKQKEVLHRRYILGMTLEQIAEKMNISRQWVNSLHGRGLQKLSGSC